jgi:hypothetical protein
MASGRVPTMQRTFGVSKCLAFMRSVVAKWVCCLWPDNCLSSLVTPLYSGQDNRKSLRNVYRTAPHLG